MRKKERMIAIIMALTVATSGIVFSGKSSTTEINAADSKWEQVWSDEFSGTSLNSANWNIEVNGNGGGNNELQYYTARKDNIEVSNGTLKIKALKESYGGKKYTSGRITTQKKQSVKYGRVEAKMKLPRFNGAWPAFWMLGESISSVGWPACGEIDIMEAINTENTIYSTVHWSYQGNHADAGNGINIADRTAWHVYAVEWNKDGFKFYVDNKLIREQNIAIDAEMDEFRQPHFIILNLAIGGNWPGSNIDDTAFPTKSVMEVDYVRVYKNVEEQSTEYTGPYVDVEEDIVQASNKTWTQFFGGSGWQGSTGSVVANGAKPGDGVTVNLTSVGTNVGGDSIWGAQAKLENLNKYSGGEYTYKCTLLSDVDKKVYVKVADRNEANLAGGVIELKANVPYNYETSFSLAEDFDSTVSLKFGMGKAEGDTIADNGSATIKISNVSCTVKAKIPDPEYVKPTTSSTSNKTTTTSNKITTTSNKITNTSNKTTTTVKKPAKVKIRKATRLKGGKKARITYKKITGVKYYQIKYSTSKKFKKSATRYVTTKKVSKVINKLKAKKTYYVKVRAIKVVKGKKYFGKWSIRKTIKVRK